MANLVELLQRLGFGEYEARAYMALVGRGALNGYEAAKASGVPRANVYAVLQKLEERGAALRIDSPEGTHYSAVPPSELAERLGSTFRETLEEARRSLEEVANPAKQDYIWNVRGYDATVEHARALVEGSDGKLMVALWPQEAEALARELAGAEQRGVDVTTLCMTACPVACGNCRGEVHRYHATPEERKRWLVVVPDGAELLAGEIATGGEALAVRSRQHLLVELAAWYIRHSIAVATLLGDLGDRLPELLSPEARGVLASVGAGGSGWVEYMGRLLERLLERET